MEELCGGCGELLMVIPNPSREMLESSGGYEFMVAQFKRFTGKDFDPETIELGLCTTCDSITFLGPQITLTGTVIDIDRDEV